MIVYGSRATEVAQQLTPEVCNNCGAQNSVRVYIFQKYAHVFWIPIFPFIKTGVSQCENCKQIVEIKDMSPEVKSNYTALKKEAKAPIWTFSGLAIVAVLFIVGIISARNQDARTAKYILDPQVGDVYTVKTEEQNYTLYKVEYVEDEDVYMLLNLYEVSRPSKVYKLKRKE